MKSKRRQRREKKKKIKESQRGKSKHHIVPSTRLVPNPNGVFIPRNIHSKFHEVYGNMTPIEILHFLFEEVWNKNYQFLYEFKKDIEEGGLL